MGPPIGRRINWEGKRRGGHADAVGSGDSYKQNDKQTRKQQTGKQRKNRKRNETKKKPKNKNHTKK